MNNLDKIRVVVADDKDCIRTGIRNILELTGDIILLGEASNGEDAICLVEKTQPDVILLDIEMPVLDGIEAAKIIKSRFPAVQIVFISGYGDRYFLHTVRELCCAGYIVKDEAPKTLIPTIRSAAGKSIQAYKAD